MRKIMEAHSLLKAFKYYLHFTHRTEEKNFIFFLQKSRTEVKKGIPFFFSKYYFVLAIHMLIENKEKCVISNDKSKWIRVDASKFNELITLLCSERDNSFHPATTIFSLSFTQKPLSLSFSHEKNYRCIYYLLHLVFFAKNIFAIFSIMLSIIFDLGNFKDIKFS